jgi:hypothetical protein
MLERSCLGRMGAMAPTCMAARRHCSPSISSTFSSLSLHPIRLPRPSAHSPSPSGPISRVPHGFSVADMTQNEARFLQAPKATVQKSLSANRVSVHMIPSIPHCRGERQRGAQCRLWAAGELGVENAIPRLAGAVRSPGVAVMTAPGTADG